MKKNSLAKAVTARLLLGSITLLAACGIATVASAQSTTRTVRVVCYNMDDDVGTLTTPFAGMVTPFNGTGGSFTTNSSGSVTNGGVLEGIGEEVVNGDPAQPIDVLALEETTSNSSSVQPIVNGLNIFYSVHNISAGYAMSPYQATESGGDPTTGNGPNAMVYNTNTLQLLASVPVDPPGGTGNLGSSSGMYREVVRYEFAPAGVTPGTNNEFYVYVSHYKASSGSSDVADRLGEARIIRDDEATNLPPNSRVLYVGDWNIDGTNTCSSCPDSYEPGYQTILSNAAPDGIMQGQGIDPLNTNASTTINWSSSTTSTQILFMLSEEGYELRYRDDLQVMSSNVYYGAPGGLQYVPGTYHSFGNNASIPYQSSVVNSANTALNGIPTNALISRAQTYTNLTGATDHLPIVADYTIPIPSTAPVASFTGTPTSGVVPLTVTFTDTSTGNVTNWFWSFGDGGTTNVTTNSVVYAYATAGVYSVTEIVSGSGGSATNMQASYITVLTPYQVWQIQYFGSTNNPAGAPSAAAPDGDGFTNLQDYLAGTNPTNSASALRITSIAQQGSDFLITWTMGSGKTNALQLSLGDGSGNYSNNFADLFTVTNTVGTVTNYLDSGAATNTPPRFYRVRLVP
jgi:PKD repeat protein